MIGKKAPAFTLKDENGEKVALKDQAGKYVVLFFYPKDSTPGCTKEACRFTELKAKFAKKNTVLFGVSADDEASHQKFIEKHSLGVTLLCDPEKKVIEKYGAWGEKNNYGKKYMGIIRTTALIGPDGKIVEYWSPVRKAAEHPDAVYEKLLEI